jgi:hypothetical protein
MNCYRFMSGSICFSLVAILFAACASATPSATPVPPPTWTPIHPTAEPVEGITLNPAKRAGSDMAYDTRTDRVIMFGGSEARPCWDDCPLIDETLIYEAATNTWIQVSPPDPPDPRVDTAMAYDAESDRTILYAGFVSNENFSPQETWSFDMRTVTWAKMKNQGPPNRYGHSMVYDSESDRIIVFGGWSFAENVGTNDTWAYDYNTDTWTEIESAVKPPGRNFQAMAYDSKADRVIMWGGDTGGVNDTSVWVFDYNSQTWQEKKTSGGPAMRWLHEMAYDSEADRTILFGGYTGSGALAPNYSLNSAETWAYDFNSNTWTLLNPAANPGAISEFGMAYLESADRLLQFGGIMNDGNISDKTWLYDFNLNAWTGVTPETQ